MTDRIASAITLAMQIGSTEHLPSTRFTRSALFGPVVHAVVLCCAVPGSASADDIEAAGQILRLALPAASAGVAVIHSDYEGLFHLGLSEAGSLGTSLALQSIVEKRRPDGSAGRAFPSDSTAVAFSAAAYLQRRYGWDYGVPAYALATFVGYSRVHADRHDWVDVGAGALIGWAFSALIVAPLETEGLTLALGYGGAPMGAHLRMAW